MKADYSSARVKLDRANEHIADLKAKLFAASKGYRLRREFNERGYMRLVFDSTSKPDQRFNALIGDAIGNLRSTLDYLYIATLFPVTGVNDRGGFPFADDVSGFRGEVNKGVKSTLGDELASYFIDEVQTYQGGAGERLWRLNKLRNIDKHRFLITGIQMASVMASYEAGGSLFYRNIWSVHAGESGSFAQSPKAKINFIEEPRASFEIFIEEPPHADRLSAVAFLEGAASDTKCLLDALAVRCG